MLSWVVLSLCSLIAQGIARWRTKCVRSNAVAVGAVREVAMSAVGDAQVLLADDDVQVLHLTKAPRCSLTIAGPSYCEPQVRTCVQGVDRTDKSNAMTHTGRASDTHNAHKRCVCQSIMYAYSALPAYRVCERPGNCARPRFARRRAAHASPLPPKRWAAARGAPMIRYHILYII